MLSKADLLFPSDLSVTPSRIARILIVGSCGAEIYVEEMRARHPDVVIDFLFSGAHAELPDAAPSNVLDYDFMVVMLPLRDFISDQAIRFKEFVADDRLRGVVRDNAFDRLRQALHARLRYNREYGLLTMIVNFAEPVRSTAPAMRHQATSLDMAKLVAALNDELAVIVSAHANAFVADWNALSGSLGKAFFNDDVFNFYTHTAPWSPTQYERWEQETGPVGLRPLDRLDIIVPSTFDDTFECIWRQWDAIYRIAHQIDQVKLVIFDLDNTLWRGQVAEHYDEAVDRLGWPVFHGWPTGLWEAVQHIRARGILVALSSKNDEHVVAERWNRTTLDHFVKLDDFVLREINWNPKPDNVARIIDQCSLTPQSVVFVDDNPNERDAVRTALQGIRVIGDDPRLTRRILLWSSETQVADLTEVALAREDLFVRGLERDALRARTSRDEFLHRLACQVDLQTGVTSTAAPISRALELLNRTNQFNTTGRRWSLADLRRFSAEGGEIMTFSARDSFSDHGMVGVVLLLAGRIEQMVMSCRVIGFGIEEAVIATIVALRPTVLFRATVTETPLNTVCRDIFARVGFRDVPSKAGSYVLARNEAKPVPAHIAIRVIAAAAASINTLEADAIGSIASDSQRDQSTRRLSRLRRAHSLGLRLLRGKGRPTRPAEAISSVHSDAQTSQRARDEPGI